jgi:hypothetical protein
MDPVNDASREQVSPGVRQLLDAMDNDQTFGGRPIDENITGRG